MAAEDKYYVFGKCFDGVIWRSSETFYAREADAIIRQSMDLYPGSYSKHNVNDMSGAPEENSVQDVKPLEEYIAQLMIEEPKFKVYRIVAFDIALRNFAVRAEEHIGEEITPLIFELMDFEAKSVDRSFLEQVVDYLDTKDWSIYDVIVIEAQIAFIKGFGGAALNNMKIQQLLETYFYCRHPTIKVVLMQPKMKYPKEIWGMAGHKKKTWASNRAKEIFEERQDTRSLKVLAEAKKVKKADDLADCLLLINAYLQRK
jgi:hypothetical protein